ncbi:MAG: hypothetical protein E2583_08300 [Comamonas sp.]|nr:hypothetical protein [Comamonas sp.]
MQPLCSAAHTSPAPPRQGVGVSARQRMTQRTRKYMHAVYCQLTDITKLLKIMHLSKSMSRPSFLLQRNKLKLALPQILFHNAPMLHCNIRLTQR